MQSCVPNSHSDTLTMRTKNWHPSGDFSSSVVPGNCCAQSTNKIRVGSCCLSLYPSCLIPQRCAAWTWWFGLRGSWMLLWPLKERIIALMTLSSNSYTLLIPDVTLRQLGSRQPSPGQPIYSGGICWLWTDFLRTQWNTTGSSIFIHITQRGIRCSSVGQRGPALLLRAVCHRLNINAACRPAVACDAYKKRI